MWLHSPGLDSCDLGLWMVALKGPVDAAFEECLIQHELNAESDKKHAEVWVLRRSRTCGHGYISLK